MYSTSNAGARRNHLTYTDTYPASTFTHRSPYDARSPHNNREEDNVTSSALFGCIFIVLSFLFLLSALGVASDKGFSHEDAIMLFVFTFVVLAVGICCSVLSAHLNRQVGFELSNK